ncbi:cytochrome-c peroxidase [Devosia nitrariae]|uniref:Methylamine utilization protein n=1 Tax=Devosia nitrariae TaxID=2071872 RepID=A0ABQ5W8R3_9HYPH|nr:cytochrome c peroxidase [Devosia nitrariae]GLQ56499.1 methylamine utilization protein [Devosia nitrariae]
MLRIGTAIVTAGLALTLLSACAPQGQNSSAPWSAEEIALITALSLSRLPELPPDPSNRVADDPAAAALGELLFSDTRLSSNGEVSCASCHLPERHFQDDLALARGVGETTRRTMPIAGTAYSPWLFWDGRKDSLWSQALGPLESGVEHGTDRTHVARVIAAEYTQAYAELFGPLPDLSKLPAHAAPAGAPDAVEAWETLSEEQKDSVDRVFANAGKAIAAFERTIVPTPTRFDAYADALAGGAATEGLMTEQEELGLKLFIGEGSCVNCHNGPLFTDNHFHNTGVPAVADLPADLGRALAVEQVATDPFNCLGAYSDAGPADCAELKYMTVDGEELVRAFKTPSLRGVAQRPPYMHAGQIGTVTEVLDHYNSAPSAPAGHSELEPLSMSAEELGALEAFLRTLDYDP